MKRTLISNPPYNMKWQPPVFAQLQPRFVDYEIPPKSNANFAFILSGIEKNDRCVFLLPCSVLQGGTKEEKEIRSTLVDKKLLEAAILCPENMFESTGIATCILIFDRNKSTKTIEMVDLREKAEKEVREQRGQYGGKSHTNRVYRKNVNILPDNVTNEVVQAIKKEENIPGFCKAVSIEKIREDRYNLLPSHYMEIVEAEEEHRSYADIVRDLNRVVKGKNACKLTINESLAKKLGFDLELYKADSQDQDLNALLEKLGAEKLERNNYFVTSKNKNEIKFENCSKEILSSVLMMIMQMWKQHIYYLNQEENRYLVELRDALLSELMSGKISME